MIRPLLFDFGIAEDLLQGLATELGADIGTVEQRSFPDGESYLRFEGDCSGRPAILACSLDRPNTKVMPLLFGAATLRDLGVSQVGLVAPYLAYMRQDKQFRSGEGVTARYFAGLLSAQFDWMVTVDPHLHRIHDLEEVYSIPARAVKSAPVLADWIREHVSQPLLIGPDSESEQWVADVAGRARTPYLILEKVRSGDREVQVSLPDIEAHRDCTPVLVDDIISTGQTMVATIGHLTELGMAAPVCATVHGVFAAGAAEALQDAGVARLVTCNTIVHKTNAIDVTGAIATAGAELLALGN